jgi:hypothetical protein
VESQGGVGGRRSAAWATAKSFIHLDAKDSLYEALATHSAAHTMPYTELIEWDVSSMNDVPSLPTKPALLKAACGAGGFGLYFVHSQEDVLSVIQVHANKAKEAENFLERLKRDNLGKIPKWSLQSYVRSKRIFGNQRCQLRAYVITMNKNLYVYKDVEVRMPSWGEVDLDEVLSQAEGSAHERDRTMANPGGATVEAFEEECTAQGNAIPYNQGRNKAETNRLMLEEVPEILYMKAAILYCVREAMAALQPTITACFEKGQAKDKESSSSSCSGSGDEFDIQEMAIAGIDLMLDVEDSADEQAQHGEGDIFEKPKLIPRIVELNNNPAMPAPTKQMSDAYRNHLVDLVQNIVQLGVSAGDDADKFDHIW